MFLSAFMVVGAPPPRAVVVGGGVGGLYAAAKLAREGVAVTLLEKNSRAAAGGRLACECVTAANGRAYRFETGPSLLLLPSIYRDAFASLGVDPDAHLDLARCNPSYAVHFNDGGPTRPMGEAEEKLMGAKALETTHEAVVGTAKMPSWAPRRARRLRRLRRLRRAARGWAPSLQGGHGRAAALEAARRARAAPGTIAADDLRCMQVLTSARASPRCSLHQMSEE